MVPRSVVLLRGPRGKLCFARRQGIPPLPAWGGLVKTPCSGGLNESQQGRIREVGRGAVDARGAWRFNGRRVVPVRKSGPVVELSDPEFPEYQIRLWHRLQRSEPHSCYECDLECGLSCPQQANLLRLKR